MALIAPLRARLSDGVAVSDHLSSIIEMDDAQWHVAAGAGYMELSEDGADYLVLVREHYEHTIKWAGRRLLTRRRPFTRRADAAPPPTRGPRRP